VVFLGLGSNINFSKNFYWHY